MGAVIAGEISAHQRRRDHIGDDWKLSGGTGGGLMEKRKLGFAVTGSFCTWAKAIPAMEKLTEKWDVFPIFSPASYATDSRFGKAADWLEKVETICGRPVWHTLQEVEPIGPKKLVDIMVVAPCTGNTLGKLANGITDTCVICKTAWIF